MKKVLKFIIFTVLAFIMAMPLAQANHYDDGDDYYRYHDSYNRHENFPRANSQFHPRDSEYYDGNQRLTLKTRADIERASSSNLHYDEYRRDYYRCDWAYNKNLGSWACEKDYGRSTAKAQPVQVCPVGYNFNATYQTCLSNNQPAVQAIQAQPTVVYINQPQAIAIEPTVTYYTYGETAPKPFRLAQTGPATNWVLFMLALCGATSFSLSRKQNKNK